jgi:hypothetical protein
MLSEGSNEIDQVIEVSLSRILTSRANSNPSVIIETKIAIFSELWNKTRASLFQNLLDKTVAEYLKSNKSTS